MYEDLFEKNGVLDQKAEEEMEGIVSAIEKEYEYQFYFDINMEKNFIFTGNKPKKTNQINKEIKEFINDTLSMQNLKKDKGYDFLPGIINIEPKGSKRLKLSLRISEIKSIGLFHQFLEELSGWFKIKKFQEEELEPTYKELTGGKPEDREKKAKLKIGVYLKDKKRKNPLFFWQELLKTFYYDVLGRGLDEDESKFLYKNIILSYVLYKVISSFQEKNLIFYIQSPKVLELVNKFAEQKKNSIIISYFSTSADRELFSNSEDGITFEIDDMGVSSFAEINSVSDLFVTEYSNLKINIFAFLLSFESALKITKEKRIFPSLEEFYFAFKEEEVRLKLKSGRRFYVMNIRDFIYILKKKFEENNTKTEQDIYLINKLSSPSIDKDIPKDFSEIADSFNIRDSDPEMYKSHKEFFDTLSEEIKKKKTSVSAVPEAEEAAVNAEEKEESRHRDALKNEAKKGAVR